MKIRDLTYGPILRNLLFIALPLTLTNIINMAYNLTDMYWIGQVGSKALTAIGTAGLFLWLSYGFFLLASNGTQIKVSHAVGEKDNEKINHYAITGLKFGAAIGFAYGVIIFLLRSYAINIFNIESLQTANWAKDYLAAVSFAVMFQAINTVYIGIFNGLGNSKTVLIISSTGLIVNMLLDPFFIHVLNMGVVGAGIATLIASMVPTTLFTILAFRKSTIFNDFKLFSISKKCLSTIFNLSLPTAIQSVAFTLIAMVISRIVIEFGDNAVGVQRLGSQFESLTWMIGIASSTAISVFVGQNFAAKQWKRLSRGFAIMFSVMSVYGLIVTIFLFTQGELLYDAFLKEGEDIVIAMGAEYLQILSLSQLGMMIEQVCAGAFYGLGKTRIPSVVSIIGNVIRIPLALYLSSKIGLNGVWWAVSISSILKGTLNLIIFVMYSIRNKDIHLSYFFTRIEA